MAGTEPAGCVYRHRRKWGNLIIEVALEMVLRDFSINSWPELRKRHRINSVTGITRLREVRI